MKVQDILNENDQDIVGFDDALEMIDRALELTKYHHITALQVLNDKVEASPQFAHELGDRDVDYWIQHIEHTYSPPEPTTFKAKVSAAAKKVNSEVMHDEVMDAITDRYGEKANELSVDDIVKFIKDGEFYYE